MKKPKRGLASGFQPYGLNEDPKIRFRYQSLLQDYEELQKETMDMQQQLLTVKRRKLTLAAEVRFLRQRYEYLMKNQTLNYRSEKKAAASRNIRSKAQNLKKGKNDVKRESSAQDLAQVPNLSQKGKVVEGTQPRSRIATPTFDLNTKTRTFGGREAFFQNCSLTLTLENKERIVVGKETSKRDMIPVFDLNEISREEEDMQINYEPRRAEGSRINLLRSGNNEQENSVKISACRNIGNGSSRAGKRKISWQDQVALRV